MEAGVSRAGRVRLPIVSARAFCALAYFALAALVLIVVTGATVRLTSSGLGCENWPRCGETFLPEKGYHAYIEFGNRVVGVLVGLSTLVAALAAWRVPALPRRLAWGAVALPLLVLSQGILGGITVIFELHPLIVMAHFLLSLVAVALAVAVAIGAHEFALGGAAAPADLRARLGWLALALLPPTLALVVTGTLVTAASPHSGGDEIARFGNLVDAVHVHVGAAAAFGVGFLAVVAVLLAERARARVELAVAAVILALLLAQVAVGEIQWREQLPWGLVLVHVALATAVWTGMVALAVRLFPRRT
jgi:cytochrome c oxidase assembly protein subunit 15